jgi:hypothetical protein
MNRRARRFTIKEMTFGLQVEFFVNTPQSKALRRCAAASGIDADDEQNKPDECACAWAFCNGNWALIWIENYPGDNGSLVHELYHVVTDFLAHIEAKDEETGAYLLAHLYRCARQKLDKKR